MMFLALTLIAAAAPAPPTLAEGTFLGGSIGDSVTATFAGTNLKNPVDVYLDREPLHARFSPVGRGSESCTATFKVPKVATGVHALRVLTPDGITNLRPFAVDDLPAAKAEQPITKKDTPLVLKGPCICSGTTTADASDFYKLSVKAKERWTFEVVGRRLGSAIDPVLIVHDAKSFRELPGLYADDTLGLQSDCRLTHTFGKDAEILIEVRDTTFRGGHGYRLRVGDFPNAVGTFPLAAQDMAQVKLLSTDERLHKANARPGLIGVERGPASRSVHGWGVSLRASPIAVRAEQEPNNDANTVEPWELPFAVSARFEKKNDRDCFAVMLKKGDKIAVAAESQEFALSTEVLLTMLDANGKELAKSDPMKLPAAIEFDAPADGRYVIVAEHLNYGYGPLEAYHLTVQHREPDAFAALGSDHASAGGKIPVNSVTRLYGYDGPIEFKWEGADGITVKGSVPAKATPTDKAPVQLDVTATAKPGVYFGRIVSQVKGRSAHTANTLEPLKSAFAGLPVVPAEMNGMIAIHVK